jgi:hypothetical protein
MTPEQIKRAAERAIADIRRPRPQQEPNGLHKPGKNVR